MKLVCLRLSNFRSFGASATEIDLGDMIFLIGPNGAGKTATLIALARMFAMDPAQRKIQRSDFHIPAGETSETAPEERELWIEADFQFPELASDEADTEDLPAIPGNFAHMQLVTADGPAQVRFRLKATLDADGEIDETFNYVIRVDEHGYPAEESRVAKQERSAIQVHYLPARRDPTDHISYSTSALLGRALRAAKWDTERAEIKELTEEISDKLSSNVAIRGITDSLSDQWDELHKGSYFTSPAVSFSRNEIEALLRHLSVSFSPGHDESIVDFSRLSDGQQSLLYISLVLAMHDIGMRVLSGELSDAFNEDKLRPATFTLVAVEEPENSLSPHYLGRVIRTLTAFSQGQDAQALVATHAPALLSRVDPTSIRYLRLGIYRTTTISQILMPPDESEEQKYVREAVQAFPELYFSRLVVLGEGDSEEIVLPRLLEAYGILADDASVSVVPLGGRHVNHFWRLLNDLGIPHVTLLDLDVARFGGGWGRIRYAARQLKLYSELDTSDLKNSEIRAIPAWDADESVTEDDLGWIARLEEYGVFFSGPLDLDFMMMVSYPDAYGVEDTDLEEPDEGTLKAVLGKSHSEIGDQYSEGELNYFDSYHAKFKIHSKPVAHLRAMAEMDDDDINDGLPAALDRMFDLIKEKLEGLPE